MTFYLGILSLIIALLTYVMLAEPAATKVVMFFAVVLTLIPTTLFVFGGVARGVSSEKQEKQEETTSLNQGA